MRILFVQPSLNPPGGGNGVAAWMIEAVKAEHRVSLLGWNRPDLVEINRYFGTAIKAGEIEVLHWAIPWAPVWDRLPVPLQLLRDQILFREARRRTGDFDLLMTASNEADLGGRGIQYVHFPRFYPWRPSVDLRWYHRAHLVRAYRHLCGVATGFSMQRTIRNLTLVNSAWTAQLYRRVHGIEPLVLHPPVIGNFPDVPWQRRSDDFVCVGRISPEKRLDLVIDVVEQLRRSGKAVGLHVAGSTDLSRADRRAYRRHIRARAAAAGDWVRLHENLSRQELSTLIASQRYGIHAMEDEHFGMSVAEMASAGCVVFAPRSGGPPEILGDERLLFSGRDDAVEKIRRVMDDADLQQQIRAELSLRAGRLQAGVFAARIRELVRSFEMGDGIGNPRLPGEGRER